MDISKVWWNGKLANDRDRVLNKYIKDGDVIADLFCGAGAFSVKCAVKLRNVKVVCNDISAAAYDYCNQNIALNNVGYRAKALNMEASDFIKHYMHVGNLQQAKYDKLEKNKKIPMDALRFNHVYMNHPEEAINFLGMFIGLWKTANPDLWWKDQNNPRSLMLPLIHVYGLTQETERYEIVCDFKKRIGDAMNYPVFDQEHIDHL